MTKLTVADLDALAEKQGVGDYPKSGTKDEKLAALDAAGVELPSDDGDESGETYPTRHAANIAYFKIDAEKRAELRVSRDDKTGLYSIKPRGK